MVVHAVDHWTVEALRTGTPLGIQGLSGLCLSLGQPWLHTEPHSQKIKRDSIIALENGREGLRVPGDGVESAYCQDALFLSVKLPKE